MIITANSNKTDDHSSSNTKGCSMNGRLAVYTSIYCDIGEATLKRLFTTVAEIDVRIPDRLGKCKPHDISSRCWNFAVFG